MAPTSSGPLNPVNTSRLWPRATHTTDTVNFDQLVQLTEEVREHASTRVQHQDFMSKFFAMFYHYPESRFPKGPWTLDGPVPSSEDYVPDASTVRLRAGRIANLSLPRRIEVAAIRGESKPAKLDGAGRSGDSVRGPKSKRADDMAVAVESPCRTARQGAGKDIMPRLPPYYLRKPPIIGQSCEGEKLSVPHQKQDQLGGIILPETAESNNRGGRIATKVAMRTLLRRTTSAGLRGESGENRIIKVDVTMGDVVNSTVAKEGRRADAQVLTDELNLQFGHTWERQILKSKKPLDNRNMQCRISSGKPTRQSVLKTSLMVNPNDKNGLKNRNVGAPSNESGGIEGPGASFGFENGDGLHNQDPRPLETSGGRPSSRATRASSSSPIRATRRTMSYVQTKEKKATDLRFLSQMGYQSANPGEPKKDSRVGPTLEIMDGVLETATIEHDGEAHKKTTEPTEATTNSLPHEVRIGADDNGQTSKDEGGDNKIVQQKIGAVDAAHVPTNSAQSMDDLIGPGGSAFFRRHFNKLLEVLQKDDWNRSEEERQFIETCLKSLPSFKQLSSSFILTHLASQGNIQRYTSGAEIVSRGELGTAWYLILSGQIAVVAEGKPTAIFEDRKDHLSFSSSHHHHHQHHPQSSNVNSRVPHNTLNESMRQALHGDSQTFSAVGGLKQEAGYKAQSSTGKKLSTGDTFGGYSLVHDTPHTATLLCETEVLALVYSKSCFWRMRGHLKRMEQKTMEHFLRHRVPLFSSLPENVVGLIAKTMKRHRFSEGQVVIAEGYRIDELYVVRTGRCAVLRNIQIKEGSFASQTLVGNMAPGAHFNEGSVFDRSAYRGCPFTVVALNDVECISAVGISEWTTPLLGKPQAWRRGGVEPDEDNPVQTIMHHTKPRRHTRREARHCGGKETVRDEKEEEESDGGGGALEPRHATILGGCGEEGKLDIFGFDGEANGDEGIDEFGGVGGTETHPVAADDDRKDVYEEQEEEEEEEEQEGLVAAGGGGQRDDGRHHYHHHHHHHQRHQYEDRRRPSSRSSSSSSSTSTSSCFSSKTSTSNSGSKDSGRGRRQSSSSTNRSSSHSSLLGQLATPFSRLTDDSVRRMRAAHVISSRLAATRAKRRMGGRLNENQPSA